MTNFRAYWLLRSWKPLFKLHRTCFLKLWYAYHYWNVNYCLLQRDFNESLNTKNIKIWKKIIIRMTHTFASKQHCLQRCVTHPHCRPVFPIWTFFSVKKKKKGGILKVLKFYLVVGQRKKFWNPWSTECMRDLRSSKLWRYQYAEMLPFIVGWVVNSVILWNSNKYGRVNSTKSPA